MAEILSRSAAAPPGPPTFALMTRMPLRRIERAASAASPGDPIVTVMSVRSSVPAPPNSRQRGIPSLRATASTRAVSSAHRADPHPAPPQARKSAAIALHSAASRPGSQAAARESASIAADWVSPL